jgi:mRNA deadenylase 3'-5' endonuclease subunit Ccr4
MWWLGAKDGKSVQKEPFGSETTYDGGLEMRDEFELVSYNILSLESGEDDYYRNLDGTPKKLDKSTRRDCITNKIEKWMEEKKIICLQEVTATFLNPEFNPGLELLRISHKYSFYSHLYSYMPNKVDKKKPGNCTLGLAVMIPCEYYSVERKVVLRPWESAEMSMLDKVAILDSNRKLEQSKQLLCDLGKDQNNNKLKVNAIELMGIEKVCERIDSVKMLNVLESIQDADGQRIYQLCLKSPTNADLIQEAFVYLQTKNNLNFLNASILLAYLNKLNEMLRQNITHITDKYKKSTPRYADRSVIILHIKNYADQELLVANIHAPCQFKYPKLMTSIALNAKKSIIGWMKDEKIIQCPMILCGDFNAGKTNSAYQCFTGSLEYANASLVNHESINESEFAEFVRDEKWKDVLEGINGCTNYGFTASSFNECCNAFKLFMDTFRQGLCRFMDVVAMSNNTEDLESSDHHPLYSQYLAEFGIDDDPEYNQLISDLKTMFMSRSSFFQPKQLFLDHFFVREGSGKVQISDEVCTPSWSIEYRTNGTPIPRLDINEPSDHLPISLKVTLLQTLPPDERGLSEPVRSRPEFP